MLGFSWFCNALSNTLVLASYWAGLLGGTSVDTWRVAPWSPTWGVWGAGAPQKQAGGLGGGSPPGLPLEGLGGREPPRIPPGGGVNFIG